MIEVRWYARAGQGAWTASNLLAMAAVIDGKYVQSFPAFGPERSGAPMFAFTRVSSEPILVHSMIYEPGVVVVLDHTLISSRDTAAGLKNGGVLVLNYSGSIEKLYEMLGVSRGLYKVYVAPATELAMELLKRPITSTAMLGALVKATNIVSMDAVVKALKERFPSPLAERNIELVKRAFEKTVEV